MRAVIAFAALCISVELLLLANALGVIGAAPTWRAQALQWMALQPLIVDGGQLMYPAQNFAMFMTYAVLHKGPLHLISNMLPLFWLAREMHGTRDSIDMALLGLFSAVGAALAYVFLAPGVFALVVGASGLCTGVLGAWVMDGRPKGHRRRDTVLRLALLLGALAGFDLLNRFLLGQEIAWQAHVGGALAGAAFALLWPPHHKTGLQSRH